MGSRGQDKSFFESFIPPPNNKGHAQGDAASPAFYLLGEKCNDRSLGCHLVMLWDKPEEKSQHAEDGKDLVLQRATEKEPMLAPPPAPTSRGLVMWAHKFLIAEAISGWIVCYPQLKAPFLVNFVLLP